MSRNLRVSHPYPGLATAGFEVFQSVWPFSRGQVIFYSVKPIDDVAAILSPDASKSLSHPLHAIHTAIDHARSFFDTLHLRNRLLKSNPFGIVQIRVENDRYPGFPIEFDVVPALKDNDPDLMIDSVWDDAKDVGPLPRNDIVPLGKVMPLPKTTQDFTAQLIRQDMWREAVHHKPFDEFVKVLQAQVPSFQPHQPRHEVRESPRPPPVKGPLFMDQVHASMNRYQPTPQQRKALTDRIETTLNRPHPKEIRPKGANVIRHAASRVTM
jgi:hypothetical protein